MNLFSLALAPTSTTVPEPLLTRLSGTAFREIKGELFPSVGMKKPGEYIRVNFGQSPFVFDIDGMMAVRNEYSLNQLLQQIRSMDYTTIQPLLARVPRLYLHSIQANRDIQLEKEQVRRQIVATRCALIPNLEDVLLM